MTFPAKSVAYISLAAPVIVAAGGPIGPIVYGILTAISGLLALFGFGGPDCDKLITEFNKTSGAQELTGGNKSFGGKIAQKTKCVCGGKGEVIVIGPPKEAFVVLTQKSQVFDYGSLKIGNWVLGNTSGRKMCNYPPAFEVDIIGTSR